MGHSDSTANNRSSKEFGRHTRVISFDYRMITEIAKRVTSREYFEASRLIALRMSPVWTTALAIFQ
jgi:hypothetical protein